MALQFHRAVEHMGIWSANSDGFSFVITHESPTPSHFTGWVSADQRVDCQRELASFS